MNELNTINQLALVSTIGLLQSAKSKVLVSTQKFYTCELKQEPPKKPKERNKSFPKKK